MTACGERLLTITEVATLLRVRASRAYDLARGGLLPGVVRIGRQIRIDAAALDAWIAGGGQALNGGWRHEGVVGGDLPGGTGGRDES